MIKERTVQDATRSWILIPRNKHLKHSSSSNLLYYYILYYNLAVSTYG